MGNRYGEIPEIPYKDQVNQGAILRAKSSRDFFCLNAGCARRPSFGLCFSRERKAPWISAGAVGFRGRRDVFMKIEVPCKQCGCPFVKYAYDRTARCEACREKIRESVQGTGNEADSHLRQRRNREVDHCGEPFHNPLATREHFAAGSATLPKEVIHEERPDSLRN
jgi:hypothetical protein